MALMLCFLTRIGHVCSSESREGEEKEEEEALQLFQTVLVNPPGCVSCIKLRQSLKDFFGLESSSVLSLGI